MEHTWTTRHSLLERMQTAGNEQAWEDFVIHYRPFIHYLLNKLNVFAADQDDLEQEILLRLHRSMNQYAKEKAKFRTWLSTIIRNTAFNFFDKQKRYEAKHSTLQELPELLSDSDESEFETLVEVEWQQFLINQVLERLRPVFSDKVIKCFSMTLQDIPVEDIAQALDIKKETVYTIRTRMKTRVAQELQELIFELEF